MDGSLSNKGQKIDVLFNRITSDKYFLENLPKSLDRNYFHNYIDNSIKDKNLNDVIYTLLEVIPLLLILWFPHNQTSKLF